MIKCIRFFIFLLVFLFILAQIQNTYAQCTGTGNYCVGQVVHQYSFGCTNDPDTQTCKEQWGGVITLSCIDTANCSLETEPTTPCPTCGECDPDYSYPNCRVKPYNWPMTFSCCLYAGAGGGGGSCDTTAPSNLSANWDYSASQVRFSWTPGQGIMRVSQYIAASETLTDLQQPTNCNPDAGANCIILEPLSIYDSSYIADKSLFIPSTTYYWGVITRLLHLKN